MKTTKQRVELLSFNAGRCEKQSKDWDKIRSAVCPGPDEVKIDWRWTLLDFSFDIYVIAKISWRTLQYEWHVFICFWLPWNYVSNSQGENLKHHSTNAIQTSGNFSIIWSKLTLKLCLFSRTRNDRIEMTHKSDESVNWPLIVMFLHYGSCCFMKILILKEQNRSSWISSVF